ncbi:uncharacterized protein LOC116802197 [Drosophila sechellia]|uniref:uncharacterized protein LOC116802197 n=1 Tax=Drosophila sechellia TaxID=7238 RepID=UPI0013DDA1D1|nr:uncharacterized protein LOC116802197 [Drosophila sechellia]
MRGGRAELSVGNLPTPHGAFRCDQLDPNRRGLAGTGDWGGRAPSETRPTGCSDRSSLGILWLNSEFAFSIKLDCDGCSLSAAKNGATPEQSTRFPNRASSERPRFKATTVSSEKKQNERSAINDIKPNRKKRTQRAENKVFGRER